MCSPWSPAQPTVLVHQALPAHRWCVEYRTGIRGCLWHKELIISLRRKVSCTKTQDKTNSCWWKTNSSNVYQVPCWGFLQMIPQLASTITVRYVIYFHFSGKETMRWRYSSSKTQLVVDVPQERSSAACWPHLSLMMACLPWWTLRIFCSMWFALSRNESRGLSFYVTPSESHPKMKLV